MPLRAGFAEIDITPPIGTKKIGWLEDITIESIRDPLRAHVSVLECDGQSAAFIQLDTLSIRWTQVNDIRQRVERDYGFPGDLLMVCATHNHAGPAIANVWPIGREEKYVETMIRKIVKAFGAALDNRKPAQFGFGSTLEWEVPRNRRFVTRDGTVKTHPGPAHIPNILYREGPVDPEVAVLAFRNEYGEPLGCLVNFACHPTHEGGSTVASAGYPGVLADEMKRRGVPVTLFLNGACGNISHSDPFQEPHDPTMEEVGAKLAKDVAKVIEEMSWRDSARIDAAMRTIELPYRNVTEAERKGKVFGAQRFRSDETYEGPQEHLLAKMRKEGRNKAEVQAIFFEETAFVGIPAEYFVEHGLRIKEETYPAHALVVGHANGMVGYVPTERAFQRGGYETTFLTSSRLAPEAGDMLADTAIELIRTHISKET
jgi:hypothetical protein